LLIHVSIPAGVLSVARGALDAREVAPQHAVVAETIGV
jgi:hypothetical protein